MNDVRGCLMALRDCHKENTALESTNNVQSGLIIELVEVVEYMINCGIEKCEPENDFECITCRAEKIVKKVKQMEK